MKRPRSIMRRLVFRLLLLFLLAPALAGINILIVGEQGGDPRTVASMERQADGIAAHMRFDHNNRLTLDRHAVAANPELAALRFAIYGSLSTEPVLMSPGDLTLRSWDFVDGYQTVRRVDGRSLRLLIAPPAGSWSAWLDWYLDELTDEILPILIVLMVITLPLSALSIRQGLAPVRQLSAEAAKIDPGEGNARLSEEDAPLELLPLVRAVNRGLERLDAGLASQRRFSATVAHELRTPLAVLLGQLEREAQTPGIVQARRQVLRLSRLVDQLLTISELTARRVKTDSAVDLSAVARDAVAQEVPRALDSGLSIELDAPDRPVTVHGNAAAIGTALRNLIDNAVRHSTRGGRVLVRVLADANAIEVADQGPGIAPNLRDRVFEPFWRNPLSKGAGVGLAIVREMAELHGGHVSVRPNLPRGSVFRVEFPRADPKAA